MPAGIDKAKHGIRHGDSEKERALIELALTNGNAARAAKHLKEDGIDITSRTLSRWKTSERDRYLELRHGVLQKVRAHAASESMKSATKRRELADEIVDELRKRYPEMEARYLASSALSMDTAAGIHIDKAEKLADQPAFHVHASSDEILRKMAARGMLVEGEAEEIPAEALPKGDDE